MTMMNNFSILVIRVLQKTQLTKPDSSYQMTYLFSRSFIIYCHCIFYNKKILLFLNNYFYKKYFL